MRWVWTVPVLALASWSACSDPVDKAAKARIFSPEDPPKVVATASETLDVSRLAADKAVARRVLTMGAAELTERLGAHHYRAAVSFDWNAGEGKQVKLAETRSVDAAEGGVAGDFHAKIDNSRDQGLEVYRIQGAVYARSRHGKFRQRLRDRGMAEREREELYGGLKDLYSLWEGRIELADQGTAQLEGRSVRRFVVSLMEKAPPALDTNTAELPELPKSKAGPDRTTQRRLAFFERKSPRSLEGSLWVDEKTGVVLKAQLQGRLQASGLPATDSKGTEDAVVKVSLDQALTQIGKPVALKPPPDFLPDQDKPSGIADALDRFGIPRGEGLDGGTAPKPGVAKEPEDE